jgi:hypothetical protein
LFLFGSACEVDHCRNLASSREELEKNDVNVEAAAATKGRPIAGRLGFWI